MNVRRSGALLLLVFAVFAIAAPVRARQSSDTSSIDAVIAALYDSISGPAGERDWDRFRALFIEDARLISVRVGPDDEVSQIVCTVDGYIEGAGQYFSENAFYERELSRTMDSFGHIAQIFSTYGTWSDPEGDPRARGINSIQLVFDGDAWRIVTILWDSEREGQPIPDEYLAG